jgi:hypothetical protein
MYNKTASQRETEQPRDLKYFEAKFEARIEDSKEYRQYSRRMPYADWDGKLPLDVAPQVVPMKAIHLTIDNFERLIREQDLIVHLQADAYYGKKLCNMLREEERVRDSNPAVEKAYRNYQILLELARK